MVEADDFRLYIAMHIIGTTNSNLEKISKWSLIFRNLAILSFGGAYL